jgi:hypothetical protein
MKLIPTLPPRARKTLLITALAVAALLLIVNRFGHHAAGTAGVVPQTAIASSAVDDGDVPFTTDTQPAPAASSSTSPAGKPASSKPATNDGDDGADDDTAPVLVQPTTQADVKQAATEFVAAWLNTYGQTPQAWRQALLPRVTADLGTDLADADPGSVPAAAKAGPVTITSQGVLATADAVVLRDDATHTKLGVLHLTVVDEHGTHLISEIDWTPVR